MWEYDGPEWCQNSDVVGGPRGVYLWFLRLVLMFIRQVKVSFRRRGGVVLTVSATRLQRFRDRDNQISWRIAGPTGNEFESTGLPEYRQVDFRASKRVGSSAKCSKQNYDMNPKRVRWRRLSV